MSLMICSPSASLRLSSSELRIAAGGPSAPASRFLRSRSKFFFAQTLLGQKTAHSPDRRQHFSQITREGKPQRVATPRSARRFGHAAYFLTISKTRCRRVSSRICCTGGVGFNNRTAPLRVQAVL